MVGKGGASQPRTTPQAGTPTGHRDGENGDQNGRDGDSQQQTPVSQKGPQQDSPRHNHPPSQQPDPTIEGQQAACQRAQPDVDKDSEMNRPDEERTLHPSDLFRQLARLMREKDEQLLIKLPAHTTWGNAVRAAYESLKDTDEPIFLKPRGTESRRELQQMALQLNEEPPKTITGCQDF